MANNKPDKGLRNTVIATVAFIVIALVGITLYTNKTNNSTLPATSSKADGYGIVFNKNMKPQIDLWEDFQCPICHAFEGINNSYINEVVNSGKAKVVFHPMAFIGMESMIAANAAACSNDESRYVDFHKALYDNQPAKENSGVWTNDVMISLGKSIGITSSKFADCVNSGKYMSWIKKINDDAAAKNVNSTPTVFVNGKEIDRQTQYMDANGFKAALAAGGVK
jgi:protein-disulfide isomerase